MCVFLIFIERYSPYLICILMNINETIKNWRNINIVLVNYHWTDPKDTLTHTKLASYDKKTSQNVSQLNDLILWRIHVYPTIVYLLPFPWQLPNDDRENLQNWNSFIRVTWIIIVFKGLTAIIWEQVCFLLLLFLFSLQDGGHISFAYLWILMRTLGWKK